jgi:hypothetical protein
MFTAGVEELRSEFQRLRAEGERLAGGLRDLSQRATVYHHLFQASGGRHIFPLIAAHGALWARGYFDFGRRLGERIASCQYLFRPELRRKRLAELAGFADAFRQINRRVCVDTYVNFHFTSRWGETPAARELIAAPLLGALNAMHASIREERPVSDAERRDLFRVHFLDEQERVVGPSLQAAVDAFSWRLMRWLALKPTVKFSYLPSSQALRFWNFSSRDERIANGLKAFDTGAALGWSAVAAALDDYQLLPKEFFDDNLGYFAQMRDQVLAAGVA